MHTMMGYGIAVATILIVVAGCGHMGHTQAATPAPVSATSPAGVASPSADGSQECH